jgi:phospholipase/lecithinase/hemolysin
MMRWTVAGLLVLLLTAPMAYSAQTTFGQIVVFGDSLSDSGNAFALQGITTTPPYDTLDPLLIPGSPFAMGGHHFSNGATWVEQFARPLGLTGNVLPVFRGLNVHASNYAVGGARARDDGINFNLSVQVNAFLTAHSYAAPSDGLYVIEFGGNDLRDALQVLSSGGDASAVVSVALASIGNNIGALYAAGARKFLVWNAPNLRPTPAIRILDNISPGAGQAVDMLANTFNAGLAALLSNLSGLPDVEIKQFDVYKIVNDIVDDPQAYGLEVVNTACVMPNVPPFECQLPDEYLFWDGIHPTKIGHSILAQEVAYVLAH